MSVQLIFCVETRKSANTDWVYIKEALTHFETIGTEVKLSPLYMKSKSQFMSNKMLQKIQTLSRQYKNGNSYVIFCIDTDNIWADSAAVKANDAIKEFCAQHGFFFVWMCQDVEDVFLGNTVEPKNKVSTAAVFRRKEMILNIKKQSLQSKSVVQHRSNLLTIVEECLEKK